MFQWFNSVGGTNLSGPNANPYLDSVFIPGATVLIKGSLNSTSANEFTLGATKRLGSRGMFRIDLVDRVFKDFYVQQLDTSTGKVTTSNGTRYGGVWAMASPKLK